MTREKLAQKAYRIFNDEIEEMTYEELLHEYIDETTTPHGVGSRLFIKEVDNGFAIYSWGHNGNNPYRHTPSLVTYETREEAELVLFDCFEYDLMNSEAWWSFDKAALEKEWEDFGKEL